jgi:hypothetical protein
MRVADSREYPQPDATPLNAQQRLERVGPAIGSCHVWRADGPLVAATEAGSRLPMIETMSSVWTNSGATQPSGHLRCASDVAGSERSPERLLNRTGCVNEHSYRPAHNRNHGVMFALVSPPAHGMPKQLLSCSSKWST